MHQDRTDDASDRRPHPWRTRVARALVVVACAVLGTWVGLLVGARVDTEIGPLEVRLSLGPSFGGDTVLRLPPVGSVVLDTHDAPLRLTASVDGINVAGAREIFDNPGVLEGLEGRIVSDLRSGMTVLVARALVAAGAGGLAAGLLLTRRQRTGWVTGGAAMALVAGSGGLVAVTLDGAAIQEPRYDGLVAGAPALIGDAETIVANFDDYREGLASLVSRVSRLYDVTSTLPAYEPDDDVIRVLHVSDLHVNPTSWAIIRSVVEQFDVDVVADTGDTVHQGSTFENAYVDEISSVGVPYVWVRGNHDSSSTARAVAAEPNATVLDGDAVEVAGLTFYGLGDARFTPDKERADLETDEVTAAAAEAADEARAAGVEADLSLVHNPRAARELDGIAPVVLCGHMHARDRELLPGGTMLFQQGSTGASGPNALRNEEPTPIQLSVMYFDADTRELEAWDDITFGGLGQVSAQIERHLVQSFAPADLVEPAAGHAAGTSTAQPLLVMREPSPMLSRVR